LACAAAIAAIKTTVDEGLVHRSAELGSKLLSDLQAMASKYPGIIREVRGKGLLAGIEFDLDDFAALVIGACGRRKLLVAYSLNNPKVIRIEPPLIITPAEIERAIGILDESISETADMVNELGM
jgi:putrescine aminotransferase